MKKPNVFIVGAPKCGTTSLAMWLRTHPAAFMSDLKEPMFFNTDFGWRNVARLEDYEALFRKATDAHVAVAEASTFYLCSHAAVPAILDYSPDARFVVMLRRPTDMVVSLHAQSRRGFETESFERAWRLQAPRANGEHLPRFARHPELYQYGERACVGAQLDRLLRKAPRDRVLVTFLEDLAVNPEAELSRVQSFLGLPPFQGPLPRENIRPRVRSDVFKGMLQGLGHVKRALGFSRSTGLLAPLYRRNITAVSEGVALSPPLERELNEFFTRDVALVRGLVGRVPKSWMPTATTESADD